MLSNNIADNCKIVNIPAFATLLEQRTWRLARLYYKDGKKQLPYVHPHTFKPCSKEDALTDYATATDAMNLYYPWDNLVLKLQIPDGLIVLDSDYCRCVYAQPAIDQWAQALIDRFPSYWEVSI